MATDMEKYLDLNGLIHYDEELKGLLNELLAAHSKTLTIGDYTYDGTQDVNVKVYGGEIQ